MTYYSINIDGKEIKALPGQTILQVAQSAGIEIPTLCYDERVATYGACGLCVVEVEGTPKLLRACATEISDGMIIHTDSTRVHQSRKIALELLLSNHKGDCRPPCHEACPGESDCQGYVGLIANGYIEEALALIKESYPLPASIGRVCPHPCEEACRRGKVEEPIAIAWLKQFAADMDLASGNPFMPELAPATGKKVAIIGGGPSGLTFAYFMAKDGHQATIFEQMPKAGGMLRYGIPEYRLPKAVLDEEIKLIEQMGVEIKTDTKLGRDIAFSKIYRDYDAVYIATGAWQSSGLRCEGEDMEGVLGGIEFLGDVAQNKCVEIGNRVAVVGGGNTAMDACRTAVRLGAKEVYLLYRRTKNEMPADQVEIKEAEEEGVIFKYLVAPTRVIGENGRMTALELQQMELGEPDASGRRRPVPIEGALETIELDTIIAAIGQKVLPLEIDDPNVVLDWTDWHTIVADEATFQTSIPGVFAGGDAINNGPGIAIAAIGHAKKAARVVDSYLHGSLVPYIKPFLSLTGEPDEEFFASVERASRPEMFHLPAAERRDNFKEIVQGYSAEQAMEEANRCLECGCCDLYECKLLEYARQYEVEPERIAGEVNTTPIDNEHPYILRNYSKCVLCGLCIRTCEEVVGVSALGLLDRGFDSTVEADFGVKLLDSRCVSCGQCVAVCPTGALTEKQPEIKSVPLATKAVPSVCNYCGVGCKLELHQHGNMPVKVTPAPQQQLCPSGRFGYQYAMADYNLNYPMVRLEDEMQPATFEEAYLTINKRVQALQAVHGRESIAVVIGDKLSTEEIFLARHLAHDVLGTELIYSANATAGGISDIIGIDGSTNSYAELDATDLIVVIGDGLLEHYPMLGNRVMNAAKHGVELAVIANDSCLPDSFAKTVLKPGDDVSLLKQIVKALYELNSAVPASFKAEFVADLATVEVSAAARAFAEQYAGAKHAMIVFDRGRSSRAAAELVAEMAVLAGKLGSPRNGIIQLRPRTNTQSLIDIGVKRDTKDFKAQVEAGKVKGALFFGHDGAVETIGGLDFLMVADTCLSTIMPYADVILPLAGFGSVSGSYVNSEGRLQRVEASITNVIGQENWQTLAGLVHSFDHPEQFDSLGDIHAKLAEWYPDYKAALLDGKDFIGFEGGPIRLTMGYPFIEGMPRLLTVNGKAALGRDLPVEDIALDTWQKAQKHYGIK